MRSKKFMFIKQNILLLFFITFILFFNKSYAQECIDLAQSGQRKLAIQAVVSQLYLNNLVIKFDETKKRYLYLPQEMKSLTDAIEAGLCDLSKDVKLAIQTEQKLIEEADDILEYQYSLNEQTASVIDIMLSAPLKQRDIDLDLDFLDDKARDEVRATLNKYNIDFKDFNFVSEYYTNEIDELLGYVPGDPYATKTRLIASEHWSVFSGFSTNWHPSGNYVVVTGGYGSQFPGPTWFPHLVIYDFDEISLNNPVEISIPPASSGFYSSIDWSPDGGYLLAGGSSNSIDGNSIRIFTFDEGPPKTVTQLTATKYDPSLTFEVESVAWHPYFSDTLGGFFAVVGKGDDTVKEIQIYKLTDLPPGPPVTLELVDSIEWGTGSTRAYSCSWSKDGEYLAVGGRKNNAGQVLQVFKFISIPGSEELVKVASMNYDDFDFDVGWVSSVDWSTNDQYLALASNTRLEVYKGHIDELPQIAMNEAGDAFTVWRDSSGSKSVILALKYDVLTGLWQEKATSLSSSDYDSFEPQVAINNNGDAIAVWKRNDGGGGCIIQANRYDANTGSWQSTSAVTNLSLSGQNASLPKVVMDDEGSAIAVWQRPTGISGEIVIQANMYNGTNWQDPIDVINISDVNEESTKPQIAMNDERDAIAVWRNFDGGDNYGIQARKYDHNSCDWLSVDTIFSGTFPSIDNPQIAMSNEIAIIVWEGKETFSDPYYPYVTYKIGQARVNIIGKGWEQQNAWEPSLNKEPKELSLYSSNPQISMCDYEGIAIWEHVYLGIPSPLLVRVIQAEKYILGQGWQSAEDIYTPEFLQGGAHMLYPQIAMDGGGNAIVASKIKTGDFGVIRYNVATDLWEDKRHIGGERGSPIVMDRMGNAIVMQESLSEIGAIRYNVVTDAWRVNLGFGVGRLSLKIVRFDDSPPEYPLTFFMAWNNIQILASGGARTTRWAPEPLDAVGLGIKSTNVNNVDYNIIVFQVDFFSETLIPREGSPSSDDFQEPYQGLAWRSDGKYISAVASVFFDIFDLDYDYFEVAVDTFDTSVPTNGEVGWSNKGGRDIDILSNILGQNQEKNGTKSMPVKFSIPTGYTGAAHFDPHINPACTSADDGLTGILDASIEVTDLLLGARKRNCRFMQDNLKLSKRLTNVYKKSIEIKKTEKARVIDRPGMYTLNKDVHGVILIDADNIILDLNGCKIFSDSKIPITVNKNRKNIIIKNGSIIGGNQYLGALSGVLVQEGAQHITLENLTITFCYEGVTFKGEQDCSVTDCLVEDCAFKSNIKAAQLDCAESVTFKECEFLDCFLENVNLENNDKNCCE